MKPFNPILGETWQARYSDGTQLFFEQTSHHPPISSFQVFGADDLYYFHGYHEYTASFKANGSLIGGQVGPNIIEFPDGGVIVYQQPFVHMAGALWGERIFNWIDRDKPIQFIDEKNNIRCDLNFNPDALSGLRAIVSNPKTPCDYIRGIITPHVVIKESVKENVKDKKSEKEKSKEKDKDKDKDKEPTVLSRVEGSWLDELKFDDVFYWKNRQYQPFFPVQVDEEALPSDSRYRIDLIALRSGDLQAAQKSKTELENLQRKDRKLRKELCPPEHKVKPKAEIRL
jgi:hypothetical protein